MAKASRKSTPAASGKLISTSASIAGKGNIGWVHYSGARFVGEGKLDARKPVVAERSEFSKPAAKSNRKQHLEKSQDAAELDDYLDELAAKSEPNVAAPPPAAIVGPDPFHTGAPGRPGANTWIEDEAKRRISTGEVVPARGGLSAFARALWTWWDRERQTSTPARISLTEGTIRNIVRPIWNAALRARN